MADKNGGGKKPFYRKPLWISMMAIFGGIAAMSYAVKACNELVVIPAKASVARIAADTAAGLDRPIKQRQTRIMREIIEIKAYQKAVMTPREIARARKIYKRDSADIFDEED